MTIGKPELKKAKKCGTETKDEKVDSLLAERASMIVEGAGTDERTASSKGESTASVAPSAGHVTSKAGKAGRPRLNPQTKRISKSDRALRKMAEDAEPGRCHTLNEIAEVMGITRERVRQIEMSAMRTFRNRLGVLLKSEGVSPSEITAAISVGET